MVEIEKEVQVKSAERVRDHGEVLTARREVEAMLDLVKNESERIDSRFLEPACGDGNFLVAILERKLKTVSARYKGKKVDFEVNLLSALASIYGIDLLEDNIKLAIDRMLEIACQSYKNNLKEYPDDDFKKIMRFILKKNILQGDSLNGIDKIIFTQWSLVGYKFKREEFSFSQLNQQAEIMNTPLFAHLTSDKGEDVFIPQPIKEYPLTYYRNLGEGVFFYRLRNKHIFTFITCEMCK
ncbi:MAG: SAM-dependent DNA methyltransferase [Cyanobacteria bacterium RUI128]|nr:SAM-dependent DNA methyltransferase [Cyanobacteria bacterium RUI128]